MVGLVDQHEHVGRQLAKKRVQVLSTRDAAGRDCSDCRCRPARLTRRCARAWRRGRATSLCSVGRQRRQPSRAGHTGESTRMSAARPRCSSAVRRRRRSPCAGFPKSRSRARPAPARRHGDWRFCAAARPRQRPDIGRPDVRRASCITAMTLGDGPWTFSFLCSRIGLAGRTVSGAAGRTVAPSASAAT